MGPRRSVRTPRRDPGSVNEPLITALGAMHGEGHSRVPPPSASHWRALGRCDVTCPCETDRPACAEPHCYGPIPAAPRVLPRAGTARRSWRALGQSPTPHPVRGTDCSRWGRGADNSGSYGGPFHSSGSPPPAVPWRNEQTVDWFRKTNTGASGVLRQGRVQDRGLCSRSGRVRGHRKSSNLRVSTRSPLWSRRE